MRRNPATNHGEGNPESARRFNDAETRFVNSHRGKKAVRDAARVLADETVAGERTKRKPTA